MNGNFHISGLDVTLDELRALINEKFPNKSFTLTQSGEGKDESSEVISLRSRLEEKTKECEELGGAAGKAMLSIESIHQQQQSLFDDFVILRSKYDEQKNSLVEALWKDCAMHHPELTNIPEQKDPETYTENDERLGDYVIDDLLGEGQFATVRGCWRADSSDEDHDKLALKIIKKERITTFSSLRRLSNEVFHLHTLCSPYVVKISDCIHTTSKLYIVTERGGADLFDFFDNHPEGVDPLWAKDIAVNIMKGVLYIHRKGICHRDLKPENILLEFDEENGVCKNLKLCDFGLSTSFDQRVLLKDFCGSPGFFAPEMIIHGAYHGDKADLWSVGCIMLELVMGHEQFCDLWMTSYDFDVLQDKDRFTDEINTAVLALPEHLDANFPADLNNFLLNLLKVRSSERKSTSEVVDDPWLEGKVTTGPLGDADAEQEQETMFGTMDLEKMPAPSTPLSIRVDVPGEVSPTNGLRNGVPSPSVYASDQEGRSAEVDPQLLRNASQAMEGRARNHLLAHNVNTDSSEKGGTRTTSAEGAAAKGAHGTTHHEIHLPPIDPPTPSVGKARKFLNKNTLSNLQNSPLMGAVMKDLSEKGERGDEMEVEHKQPQPLQRAREHGTRTVPVANRMSSDDSPSVSTDQEMNGSDEGQPKFERANSTNSSGSALSRLDSPRSFAKSECGQSSLPGLSPRNRSQDSGDKMNSSGTGSPQISPRDLKTQNLKVSGSEPSLTQMSTK